jgi:membrane protease YdiL (CAAX protease family)
MAKIIEAFILYTLFFFPSHVEPPTLITFSVYKELFRVFIYNIPAFLLVIYLLNGKNFYEKAEMSVSPRQNLQSLLTFSAALPILCVISLCTSAAAGFFSTSTPALTLEKPSHAVEWLVLSFSCLTTGLLEETFFRVYLPKRFSGTGADLGKAFLFSTALFAFSHLYEGPWGVANAFLAGLFLCAIFAKTKNLAGIVAAHGVYNLLIYAVS